jgi:ribokinase
MADRVVLSGYATLDYVLAIDAEPSGFGTLPARLAGDWPRAGGAPLHAGARLAAHGLCAMPLVAVAPDANGALYRKACAAHGLIDRAIAGTAGKTACCVLAQHPSGKYLCLLDTGEGIDGRLTPTQESALDSADWVCITAAPAEQTHHILAHLRPHQRLAWIAKADATCFPPDLCRHLSDRADIIFYNRHERDLVAPSRRIDRITVETRGEQGVLVTSAGVPIERAVSPVRCSDATGAGDTFAGEFLAHTILQRSPSFATDEAIYAVNRLLTGRTPSNLL